MAVSMKGLDPAFQSVGNKEGTDIWRIDKSRPVPIPKSEHGNISSEHCYIFLQGRALRSGGLHHEIFYWLGKHAGQDEVEGAAAKAIELDAALGGRAVAYREAQGNETDKFLSYFKPCFMPIEQARGENGRHQISLFMCTGRHVARVKEVPFTRASLSHEDVFILETESKIFQFNGVNTDIYHRAKALDVVKYLKEHFHKKDCVVAVIEDGKFVADANSGEFWGLFGGFAPLGRRLDSGHTSQSKTTKATLLRVCEGQTKKVQESGLERELLHTNQCYIIDCGSELFTWVGRDTSLEERRVTALLVEELIGLQEKSEGIRATCTIEGFEPRELKLKFESWPINTAVPISENGRGKVAVLLKHKGFNVKGLLKGAPAQEQASSLNIGKLQVWYINGSSKVSVTSSLLGKFYSSNCYIVLHTFSGDRKDDSIIYSWLGHESTMETRSLTAEVVNGMQSSLKGAVEVRMFEGKEPLHFTALFPKLFIIKGDGTEAATRLFQVQQSGPYNWQATEVKMDATSLNSSSCSFLHLETTLFLWFGKFSTVEEQEATESLAHHFEPDAESVLTLKEGSESDQFWEVLGGKKVHPSHREPKESARDPHLFSCSITNGGLQATEVFNFTQNDLLSDEVLVLDCHSDVYVWVGRSVSDKVKSKALELGQMYMEQAAKYDGRALETALYRISEGFEPSFFKQFFAWDDSKSMDHLNVFQRKVSTLQGQKMEARRSPSMRRHSISGLESQSEVLATIDRNRLSRSSTFKSDSSPEKFSAPRSKYGNGRSPGSRSSAVSALSSMYEFQGTRDANVTTPRLSNVRTKQKSVSASPTPSGTPPRTPRPVSPRSPVIAALASMFEPYSDKKLDFAWPGLKSRTDEKGSMDFDALIPRSTKEEVNTVEEVPPMPVELPNEANNGGASSYPYERLKVSSGNPVAGIDYSKRESYLSAQDFQDTFRMDKDTFYKLPKWKQDKYKILVDLF